MCCVVELSRAPASRARLWLHAAAIALMGFGLAACSGDVGRFSDNSSRAYPDTTGSIAPSQAAPAGRVDTAQLPPPQAASTSTGIAGGGRGLASYTPPSHTL